MPSECKVEGCARKVVGYEWCNVHYQRWYRWGDPLAGDWTEPDPVRRFTSKLLLNEATGCREWQAGKDKDGYGKFKADGVTWRAHRYAWVVVNGPIPPGLVPDHLCKNHACCEASHLELVTPTENSFRGRLTHCCRGHELTVSPSGRRDCKTCKWLRSVGALDK